MKMETNCGRKLKGFMKDFLLSEWEMENIYKRFIDEIERGLSRETHNEADIKCYVTYVHDLPTGDEVGQYLALDLGGTNFRVLLVNLKGHHEAHIESTIYAIPQHIMTGPGTQLFDHIAECLAKFMHENNVGNRYLPLGFTFSFPLIQLGLTKGLLVRWTKGFQCAGVENEDVVRLLQEAITRRGDVKIDVMGILNDATGTLMSCAHRSENCKIGVIIGTGCNACYMEDVRKVDFLENSLKEKHLNVLINTEWGAFGDSGTLEFLRTDFDRIVDQESLNVGSQLFEKMISGMYLGEIVRLVLLKAIDSELLFAFEKKKDILIRNLSVAGSFETRFISDIETDNFLEFTNSRKILQKFGLLQASVEDCQKLKFICECITRRAANLVAIGLSGLINKMNEPKVTVGVDGSVYRYHPKFCQYMKEGMKRLVKPGVEFQIMLSEDGSGRGAALVAAVASKCSNK